MNFSWKSKASKLRQSKLSASYKESVAAIFQSVKVTFLTWKSQNIIGIPTLPIRGGIEFSKFLKKGGGSDFSSHKNEGVGKTGGFVFFKKRGVGITYFHTNMCRSIYL